MRHEDKIRFHNAICGLANRYRDIAKAIDVYAIDLCRRETKSLSADECRQILCALPLRNVSDVEFDVSRMAELLSPKANTHVYS